MITKDEIIKKYGEPDPNKKNNFINYDAIDNLPEGLEISISVFNFDPKKLDEYFTNVGSKEKPSWYPKTDLMYKIAEMCGIIGMQNKVIKRIEEEVDINPILMQPYGSEPTKQIIKTGVIVTKQSKVLCEDGNFRACAPESNEFNFFIRACLDFINEEDYTNNYEKTGKYPPRYNTVIKRRKRLLELEKFAVQQAETKAYCKTIRVLAGLPTGFDTEDLKEGVLKFHKFIKSKRIQKLETAARIDSIRQGKTANLDQITSDIMGSQEQIEAHISQETLQDQLPKKENNPFKQNPFKQNIDDIEREKLKSILSAYIDKKSPNRMILENKQGAMEQINIAIENYKNEDIETLKNMIERIESVKGIQKIVIDDKHDEEAELF